MPTMRCNAPPSQLLPCRVLARTVPADLEDSPARSAKVKRVVKLGDFPHSIPFPNGGVYRR